eukprot:s408_g15.t1
MMGVAQSNRETKLAKVIPIDEVMPLFRLLVAMDEEYAPDVADLAMAVINSYHDSSCFKEKFTPQEWVHEGTHEAISAAEAAELEKQAKQQREAGLSTLESTPGVQADTLEAVKIDTGKCRGLSPQLFPFLVELVLAEGPFRVIRGHVPFAIHSRHPRCARSGEVLGTHVFAEIFDREEAWARTGHVCGWWVDSGPPRRPPAIAGLHKVRPRCRFEHSPASLGTQVSWLLVEMC